MQNRKIQILDEQTINQIAAGEVIENPSSVVKELVENSLDAGATCIRVEIGAGGRDLIRISDNGYGMESADALLALKRHATSKIQQIEDVEEIATMGFRGEALASIVSIAKVAVFSCPQEKGGDKNAGVLVMAEGGRVTSQAPITRDGGTTIEVKSLFFNLPVRRKFQKSPAYDTQEIYHLMVRLALGNPRVGFELISDGKCLLDLSPAQASASIEKALEARLKPLMGDLFSAHCKPLKFSGKGVQIEGFIGTPELHKPNKTGQFLFINSRSIQSPLIGAIIRDAYGPMLPSARYPTWVLHVELPGGWVDVNVHPQKKEVRLREESILREILTEAVQKAIRDQPTLCINSAKNENLEWIKPLEADTRTVSSISSDTAAPLSSYTPFFRPKNPPPDSLSWEWVQTTDRFHLQEASHPAIENPPPHADQNRIKNEVLDLAQASASTFSDSLGAPRIEPKWIGSLSGYVIVDPQHLTHLSPGGGLCLVDQKAACLRIYWDQYAEKKFPSEESTQILLIPLTFSFSPSEAAQLLASIDLLHQIGFSLRPLGAQTFILDAFPMFCKESRLQACLEEIAQELNKEQGSLKIEKEKEKQILLTLSKSSRHFSGTLSQDEAKQLLKHLFQTTNPFLSPQGKPIILYWNPAELASLFEKKGGICA